MERLPFADPGTPDLRGPWRFLARIGRGQLRSQLLGALMGSIWMLCAALTPAAVGRAIDQGIVPRDGAALMRWSAVVFALAVISAGTGALRHRYAVENWLRASFRTMQWLGHHAAGTGAALPRSMPTGKVVATIASDAPNIGGSFDVANRFIGAIVSYLVVAVIMLMTSVRLGLLVLLGVPLLLASLSLVMKPLQRRQAQQREASGKLVELGADTVAGLRVLRGIGGEAAFLKRYRDQSQLVRRRGNQVAGLQSTLDSAQILLPGLFTLIVTWVGAHSVLDGDLQVGQLVAFYGYAAFLVLPLQTATEFAGKLTRAHVAAGKVIAVLQVPSDSADHVATSALAPGPGEVRDPTSGFTAAAGQFVAVVSARPEESAALADRLGRFGAQRTDVTISGTPIADVPIESVRDRVVVSQVDPALFTGRLRDELDPWDRASDARVHEALQVASAQDILDALDDGLDTPVEERGRTFSGGQRQRLTLTRALLSEAEILVLVEPTSAVDAHTEARIAGRLVAERAGRTTIVMTASPLLLDRADEVVLLQDGQVTTRGRHADLLRLDPAYRRVVVRGDDDAVVAS
ncbi:ABC transporter ATP-binding protein [Branchiibius sp. NY16-3462-2]|uniref:ABC transporter ATP-binding protein n=1 Tax=Branchiibius sp. NY16-3462-2 TaxID=1807500 RepID=UPI00079A3859|nr:ABC transporter ATP-binding protein [Branchiibius sp. NY16-3462-2]KYH45291.1 multidrug ABC transporter permease [Branchiibius sp. NY16-3462-2]